MIGLADHGIQRVAAGESPGIFHADIGTRAAFDAIVTGELVE